MATKILYNKWDGGSGTSDTITVIGYCKESPEEVLKFVSKRYYVMQYLYSYTPIDGRFPNNCCGLIINEVDKKSFPQGIQIISSVKELDLSIAYSDKINRTNEFIIQYLDKEILHAKKYDNESKIETLEKIKQIFK